MNILVVDDEYYIAKNILEQTDWASLGIDRQFVAYSAQQARNILEGPDTIDILLTDIEMPRETGLELVSWMNHNNYHPIVLILTGHQRFDYAQAAINLHIFGYILKPVDMDELQRNLASAIRELKQRRTDDTAPGMEVFSESTGDIVSIVHAVVLKNLSSPDLNRSMIAEEVHLNPDYLSHLYREKTGSSLSNYINEVRMATAQNLLRNSSCSLQQISDQTGFSNISYFHRQFKKYTGFTPQQYRTQKPEAKGSLS